MDVAGEQQIDVDHNIFKQRLDKEGVNIPEVPEKHGKFILALELLSLSSNYQTITFIRCL